MPETKTPSSWRDALARLIARFKPAPRPVHPEFAKNEPVRETLRRGGDDCAALRPIQHFAHFSSAEGRQEFTDVLCRRAATESILSMTTPIRRTVSA